MRLQCSIQQEEDNTNLVDKAKLKSIKTKIQNGKEPSAVADSALVIGRQYHKNPHQDLSCEGYFVHLLHDPN